ncbi:hypothetical protein WA026_008481 [Henosepilachna vigintioctopunctata]|uniref:BMP and activin membrane-bound inhibitor C-terminal domain-containing protein n=1 Tax=Henosepilachna vigintioctopunctata TaxID=420089 RepID=A0AAW1UBR3_9CUCU
MCKSSGGGCFSDLWSIAGFPAGYRGRHGCLELLNHEDKTCVNITDTKKVPTKRRNFPKPFVHCCYSDMCNHVDSPQTKYLINTTLFGESNDIVLENVSNHRTIGYSNSEVWFRAATIAVPICGAVILFVLIALAIKILRNERHNSYNHKLESPIYIQQIPIREKNCYKYERGLQYDCLKKHYPRSHNPIYRPTTVELLDYQKNSQVPLLLQNEIRNSQSDCKNETYAKLNQLHSDSYPGYLRSGGKSIILDIEKEGSANCPRNNVDNKNINDDVKFCDIKYGDKNYPKDSPIV